MSKLVLLSLLVTSSVASWNCLSTGSSAEGNVTPPTTEAVSSNVPKLQATNVTNLYNTTCGKCHGVNGEGGGGGTKTLLSEDKYDQKHDKPFFEAIKNGVKDMGMDGYGATMTDETIWALVVHIRELQGQWIRRTKGSSRATNGVYSTNRHNYKVETVIDQGKGLATPWAIDWLPDGRMIVTNRPGSVMIYDKGELSTIEGVPTSLEIGQGGMMEVAVHPNYKQNNWIYLAYTEPAASGGRAGLTKIVRGSLRTEAGRTTWLAQKTIFEADQKFYTGAGVHFGSRIAFDGKGHVFFVIGERGGNMKAQELDNPFGKVYRVNEDGGIPSDNPFVNREGAIKAIWSYGHRNPQGLVFDREGRLWVTEHAPRGGDEVNEIKKGANYGWPVICFGINYNDAPFRTPWPKEGQNFEMPIFRWMPSTGACGLDTMKGSAFPNWAGDLMAGGLSGANVDRIRVSGGKLVEREEILHGMVRVREVATGPDGFLYIALNQPDKVIRLVPAK